MNEKYEKIFDSYTFKSGATLKNRIMVAPMTTVSGFQNGMTTTEELAYYEKRSGGIGGFITACAYVDFKGKAFPGALSIDDDKFIPSLAKVAKTIKNKGSQAILQIFHGGRMVPISIIGGQTPVSASAVAAERKGAITPEALTSADVEALVVAFGEATRRAIQAGFDGVEIHGANTYLVQQFFSPHSNRRDDEWGGNLEKRMKFPLEVVKAVIDNVKLYANEPFITGYRLSPEELEDPGITFSDTFHLVEQLAETELDYLHISLMDYKRCSMRNPEDNEPILYQINKLVGEKIAIVGVGSINTPDDAMDVLNHNIPLVALGREIIIEPDWVEKVESGRESEIEYKLQLDKQEELAISDAMWDYLSAVPGWLPIAENEGAKEEKWMKRS